MKKEAQFTTKFLKWAKLVLPTCAIEVKHTRGKDYFRCAELKEHQYAYLMAARTYNGIAYKIPDDGRAFKPFDIFMLNRAQAYIVIAYPKAFAVIDVRKWDPKKKSLSSEEAEYIADYYRPLTDL